MTARSGPSSLPRPAPCPPKITYKTVTEQVKVPCQKTIQVPKQVTAYKKRVITECVPVTKKVWKRVEVCDTKTVKRAIKEPYCKTIMVPKVVTGTKCVKAVVG